MKNKGLLADSVCHARPCSTSARADLSTYKEQLNLNVQTSAESLVDGWVVVVVVVVSR